MESWEEGLTTHLESFKRPLGQSRFQGEALQKEAESNSEDNFRYVFEKAFEGLVIDRMEGNEEIFVELMADGEFRKIAVLHLMKRVYDTLKKRPPEH